MSFINYHNKKFRVRSNSENGALSTQMIFHYQQTGTILSCSYSDSTIIKGELLGLVNTDGSIEMSYQQINLKKELMTGICTSTPEILANGKILLHEKWQWTSGDKSVGTSTLEEL
ncbi:n-acetylglutamate synthase [Flavicella sediminum]|uniref:n-acetylglutamate synthase n=1 Tax=Flavicella sediminum TaxID=2585141 RepID=UPI001121775B|nr:n-acetylglutamate synthase [Flavicella sediminum]